MNLYIYFGNVPSTGLDGSLDPSLVVKTHFPNPPMGVQYLVGTVSVKEIDSWKKIPLRKRRAPAARENVFFTT